MPRSVDLGGFQVHRALPSGRSRMVGPFIFFDHFGPAVFKAGDGVDVRPHPHIGLATVTYLFDGEIVHRDSLGTAMPIRPGAVNWMTAGRGIVHSERTAADHRDGGEPLHGLQLWVALPMQDEETAPAFAHTAAADIPALSENGMTLRVVAGTLHGLRSPVVTSWDTLFAEAHLNAGATLPLDAAHEERAVYVLGGEIEIGGDRHGPERLLVLKPGDRSRSGQRAMPTLSWSAALPWTGRATSGGISSPRARSGSKPPRPTGKPAASISCRATRRNSFRCRMPNRHCERSEAIQG